jgi:hypothetical protein
VGYRWEWIPDSGGYAGWAVRPITDAPPVMPTQQEIAAYQQEGQDWRRLVDEKTARINSAAGFGGLFRGAILPTLGFAAGGAALGALSGGGGAAAGGAAAGGAAGGTAAGGATAGTAAAGGGAAAGGAGTGLLATTGYTAPMVPYAAPAVASGTGAAAGSGGILSQALRNPNTYRQIGSALSSASEGQAGERDQENDYRNSTNRAIADIYRTNQDAAMRALENEGQLDLQRRNFSLQAPSVRGRRGLAADLLANFRPATMQGLPSRVSSRMPTINMPSQLGPQGQLLARLLRDQAISETQKGDQFNPIDFRGAVLPQPQLQNYRQPGRGESILGYLGMGANIAGSIYGGGR